MVETEPLAEESTEKELQNFRGEIAEIKKSGRGQLEDVNPDDLNKDDMDVYNKCGLGSLTEGERLEYQELIRAFLKSHNPKDPAFISRKYFLGLINNLIASQRMSEEYEGKRGKI